MPDSMRRYQRYQVSAKAVVRLKGWTEEQGFDTQVNSISQGGIGVYTDIPFERAIPVSIELSFAPSDDSMAGNSIPGKIASQTKQDGFYFVGIEFDNVIPHDDFVKMIHMEY